MAVFLVKLIFIAMNIFVSFLSRFIFTLIAHLLVVIIQGLKLPGQAVQGAIEQVAEAIQACFEYIWGLIVEAMSCLISSAFDLLIETITGSFSSAGSAFGYLIEKTRTSLDELMEQLPTLADGFSEMISSMISDIWKHYKDAIGYVKANA